MQRSNEATPSRNDKSEREEETGGKMNMKDDLVESHYELNQKHEKKEEGEQDQDQEETESVQDRKAKQERITGIENQIKQIEKRLQEIRLEELKIGDQYSEDYLALEQQRIELKKRLIDLDYHSRVQYAETVRLSRRKAAEEDKKLEEQRDRRKKQLEERFNSERKKRQQERQKLLSKEANVEAEQKKQGDEKADKNQGQQQRLAKLKRQARIAEIEAQLAESRLRRSRQASLNAELDYLRATYSSPYWRWRDYFYSYPLSTYLSPYLSPYSYPYRYSYLSPYSSAYLYPYTPSYLYPSSYLYPYRYGLWP